jgi:hypothetical protein
MITVYNPLTGQWERLDDLSHPLPVILRDTRLLVANDNTTFVPSFVQPDQTGQTHPRVDHTDIFGNTNSERANIGLAVGNTDADVIILDPWRIRRIILVCHRNRTHPYDYSVTCDLWGRLLKPDGTPTEWRWLSSATDSGTADVPIWFSVTSSLIGMLGFDQYRMTLRYYRNPNALVVPDGNDPPPQLQLSLIRVYAEF